MQPLIEIRDISKRYGSYVRALDGVSFNIERGEYVAISGPSGCGKSTLQHILGLLDWPTQGQYKLAGRDVGEMSEAELAAFRGRHIGFVFQFFNLIPRMSALENVELPGRYAGAAHQRLRALECLQKVGLEQRQFHTPQQLSGGEQQRVAIARALAPRPWLLLADEPTGNLNSEQSLEVMRTLEDLRRDGVTLIVVTHDPEVAQRAERQIEMRDGKIVGQQRLPKTTAAVEFSAQAPPPAESGRFWAGLWQDVRFALSALSLNKLRTALTVLGVVVGVAAVLTMIGLGAGARQSVKKSLSRIGPDMLMIFPGNPRVRGVARGVGNFSRLSLNDAAAILNLRQRGIPIRRIDPQVTGSVQMTYGGKNWQASVIGSGINYPLLHNAEPTWGRFFNSAELSKRATVCLVGATVIKKLYPGGQDPVGTYLRINRKRFLVIGMLPERGSSTFRDRDNVVVIPVTTAMRRVLGRDFLSSIQVQVEGGSEMGEVQSTLRRFLRSRLRLNERQEDNFFIRNAAEIHRAVSESMRTIALLLGAIAAVSLIVGGIGIMNIMLVAVKERTREIGIRKAMGARSRDILWQFLVESLTVSLCGGIIGILLGLALCLLAGSVLGWLIAVSAQAIWMPFIFAVVIGIVFGLWPARQAARLNPAEALRYE